MRSSVRRFDGDLVLPPGLKGKRALDKLKLSMISRSKAADAAQLALFQIQDLTPEEMAAGAALLFTVLCLKARLDPEDMVNMANKILDAPDEGDHTTSNSLDVLKSFLKARVAAQDVTV